jgi:hypothetical protein
MGTMGQKCDRRHTHQPSEFLTWSGFESFCAVTQAWILYRSTQRWTFSALRKILPQSSVAVAYEGNTTRMSVPPFVLSADGQPDHVYSATSSSAMWQWCTLCTLHTASCCNMTEMRSQHDRAASDRQTERGTVRHTSLQPMGISGLCQLCE